MIQPLPPPSLIFPLPSWVPAVESTCKEHTPWTCQGLYTLGLPVPSLPGLTPPSKCSHGAWLLREAFPCVPSQPTTRSLRSTFSSCVPLLRSALPFPALSPPFPNRSVSPARQQALSIGLWRLCLGSQLLTQGLALSDLQNGFVESAGLVHSQRQLRSVSFQKPFLTLPASPGLSLCRCQDGRGLQGHIVQSLTEEELRPRELKKYSQSQPAPQCKVQGGGWR